jgi:hypothetical protein
VRLDELLDDVGQRRARIAHLAHHHVPCGRRGGPSSSASIASTRVRSSSRKPPAALGRGRRESRAAVLELRHQLGELRPQHVEYSVSFEPKW